MQIAHQQIMQINLFIYLLRIIAKTKMQWTVNVNKSWIVVHFNPSIQTDRKSPRKDTNIRGSLHHICYKACIKGTNAHQSNIISFSFFFCSHCFSDRWNGSHIYGVIKMKYKHIINIEQTEKVGKVTTLIGAVWLICCLISKVAVSILQTIFKIFDKRTAWKSEIVTKVPRGAFDDTKDATCNKRLRLSQVHKFVRNATKIRKQTRTHLQKTKKYFIAS